jgi:hypothetical protein
MAMVTISVHDDSLKIAPPRVHIDPSDLSITWNLAPGSGGFTFSSAPPGIVCETAPPSGFQAWGGSAAVAGPEPHQYTAKGAAVTSAAIYKYTVNLVNRDGKTLRIDPEILNEPQGN